jgi:hypothetical protein
VAGGRREAEVERGGGRGELKCGYYLKFVIFKIMSKKQQPQAKEVQKNKV